MKTFKKELSDLADFALEISGLENYYTEEDMMNATLVFMEVFMCLLYSHHYNKVTPEQMLKLSQEAGKSLNQTILLFTGFDTKKYFNGKK